MNYSIFVAFTFGVLMGLSERGSGGFVDEDCSEPPDFESMNEMERFIVDEALDRFGRDECGEKFQNCRVNIRHVGEGYQVWIDSFIPRAEGGCWQAFGSLFVYTYDFYGKFIRRELVL